jgi:nitric oxide synthase-interacting protein
LAQKKKIKRLEKARQHSAQEAAHAQALQDEEAQKRAVRDFEMVQAGLDPAAGRTPRSAAAADDGTAIDNAMPRTVSSKRKLGVDEDDLDEMLQRDRQRAKKELEAEKVTSTVPLLP